jgi:hypothetical protein
LVTLKLTLSLGGCHDVVVGVGGSGGPSVGDDRVGAGQVRQGEFGQSLEAANAGCVLLLAPEVVGCVIIVVGGGQAATLIGWRGGRICGRRRRDGPDANQFLLAGLCFWDKRG